MSINLAIIDNKGVVKKAHQDEKHAFIGFEEAYQAGDVIQVDLATENNYLIVELDGTFNPSLIFVKGKRWLYHVVTETTATAFNPNAFKGTRHYLSARYAADYEINAYQNLALNPHDQKDDSGAFPHASANVETRNDTTFFARNAIDGILANDDHGSYPFQSWGINQNPEACMRLDFGRTVVAERLSFVLRGDYPHDSYWTQGKVTFSDGSEEILNFQKLMGRQEFAIAPKEIEWLEFSELIKATDDSPFPALTQLEVYGTNK